MQKRKLPLIGLLVLGSPLMAGGCIDAFTEGAARGVSEGVAQIVATIFESALGSLVSGA